MASLGNDQQTSVDCLSYDYAVGMRAGGLRPKKGTKSEMVSCSWMEDQIGEDGGLTGLSPSRIGQETIGGESYQSGLQKHTYPGQRGVEEIEEKSVSEIKKYTKWANKLFEDYDKIADENREKRALLMRLFMEGKNVFDKELSDQLFDAEDTYQVNFNKKEVKKAVKQPSTVIERKRPKFVVDLEEFKKVPTAVLERRKQKQKDKNSNYYSLSSKYQPNQFNFKPFKPKNLPKTYHSQKPSLSSLTSFSKLSHSFNTPLFSTLTENNSTSPNLSPIPSKRSPSKSPLKASSKFTSSFAHTGQSGYVQSTPRFGRPPKSVKCSSCVEIVEFDSVVLGKYVQVEILEVLVETAVLVVWTRMWVGHEEALAMIEWFELRVQKSCEDLQRVECQLEIIHVVILENAASPSFCEYCVDFFKLVLSLSPVPLCEVEGFFEIDGFYLHKPLPPAFQICQFDFTQLTLSRPILPAHLSQTLDQTTFVAPKPLFPPSFSESFSSLHFSTLFISKSIGFLETHQSIDTFSIVAVKPIINEIIEKSIHGDKLTVACPVDGMCMESAVEKDRVWVRKVLEFAEESVERGWMELGRWAGIEHQIWEVALFEFRKTYDRVSIEPCLEEEVTATLVIKLSIEPQFSFVFIEITEQLEPQKPLERTFFDFTREKKLMISDIRSYMPLL